VWTIYTGGLGGKVTAIDTYDSCMAIESLHDNGSEMVSLMQTVYLGLGDYSDGALDD